MNPVSRRVWQLCKIDGPASRYRSEPDRSPVASAAAYPGARHALRHHPVVLQRRVLRLRLPGQLHPSHAGRAGLRDRRDAARRPGGLRRLRRVRLGLPGRRDRAAHRAASGAAAVRDAQRRLLQDARGDCRRPTLAPVDPGGALRGRGLRVAIVGSGPAAMYAADELLTQPGVQVDVFERLPTPYGLVRHGVAPDHQSTRQVTRLFDTIAAQPGFRLLPRRRGRIAMSRTTTCWPSTTR